MRRLVFIGAALAAFAGLSAAPAAAAYAQPCAPAADDNDGVVVTQRGVSEGEAAICERLEAIAAALGPDGEVDVRVTGVFMPIGAGEPRSPSQLPVADTELRSLLDLAGEGSVSTKVRLSDTDRQALLDVRRLGGYSVGLALAGFFGIAFYRTFGRR